MSALARNYLAAAAWYALNAWDVPVAVCIGVERELRERAEMLISEGTFMWGWQQ